MRLPQECIAALKIFPKEERDRLAATYREDTGEFIGIRFVGEDGRSYRYANGPKVAAIEVLEKQVRREAVAMGAMRATRVQEVIDGAMRRDAFDHRW